MSISYNIINDHENSKIKERISPNNKLYLKRLIQNVPNIEIRFFGSITNFTYFENNSDVDCCIIYPDESSRMKVIQFITDDSIEFHIKRITFQQVKLSHPAYNDEFNDVYSVFFDNRDKIDFNLVHSHVGPILQKQHHIGIVFLFFIYILKWLYYHSNIISKDIFRHLKSVMFNVKDYHLNNISVFRSNKESIKDL
jgi:hypothetical protein